MAWDKADITTDISSQVHAKGGPKANEIQATKHEAKNTGKKIDQVLTRLVHNFFSSTNFSPKLVANVFYARVAMFVLL